MPMSVVEMTRPSPEPAGTLRQAPRHEPQFDDEQALRGCPPPQQLPLRWTASGPPGHPGGPASPPLPPQHPLPLRRTVVTGVSADARSAVRRFVGTCVEVLNGHRPAAHLRWLARPREATTVVAQGLAGARLVTGARQARTAGRAPRPRRPDPAAVVRLQLCEPREGAVEAAAVLVLGDRTYALALRLEFHGGAWLATTLRLI